MLITLERVNIVGMGVDMEKVSRFRSPPRNLFTDAEVAYCMAQASSAEAFAGTWCAKEAVVKALSNFVSVLPRDVEVTRNSSGAPHAQLRAASLPSGAGPSPQLHVSITHAGGFALAVASATLSNVD